MAQYVYDIAVKQYTTSLRALKTILGKTREFAQQRGFDENQFLTLKAAPDMFNLLKQVQITTDLAKAAGGRLTSKPAPVFDDKEATMEELFARIDRTIAYLSELQASDFDNYAAAKVTFHWDPSRCMYGKDYIETYNMPNFYFHLTATYMILRSHGVQLGKNNFLGELNWQKNA